MRALTLVCASVLLSASVADAQSSSETDVPSRLVVEAGGFNMRFLTNHTLNTPLLDPTTVSFENDLGLPDTMNRGYVDAYWRVSRRNQLSLSYAAATRQGDPLTLARNVDWGGVVFPIGVRAAGRLDTRFLSGGYRFSAVKNGGFELGPAVGFGYLWMTAGISAAAGAGLPSGTVTSAIDREVDFNTPTADVGGFANWWVTRRIYIRGDFRYGFFKPSDSEAAITQARASATWYPWQHLGFGAQFVFDKFRYDRIRSSTELGGTYRVDGLQLLVSTAF